MFAWWDFPPAFATGNRPSLPRREQMPHLLFLSAKVVLGVLVEFDIGRHAFHDFDSGIFHGRHFLGIVRDQADLLHPKLPQDLRRQFVLAIIVVIAEFDIGLDGVETVVLQLVGLQLGHQAYAAPFLLLVNEDTGAGFGNHGKRPLKLLTAIAAHGMKHVAGQTLRVNAHQRRRGMDVAHPQGNGALFAALRLAFARQAVSFFGRDAVEQVLEIAFKAVDPELSPAGGEIGLGYLLDSLHSRTTHITIIAAERIRPCSGVTSKAIERHRNYGLEGCVRSVPSLNHPNKPATAGCLLGTPATGLVIFSHSTQGFRPGLTAIPPLLHPILRKSGAKWGPWLRGSILRHPFHRANSKRVLTHP